MKAPVHIDFRKWPETRHWQFSMYRLGEDRHGVWLWSPPGMLMRRGDEPPRINRRLSVKLITDGLWWTAIWNQRPEGTALYVDVATPAKWDGDRVALVDLDFDIYQAPDGTVEVLDEDEFEEHRLTLGYPDHVVDKARTTTAATAIDVELQRPPFDTTAELWLARARELAAG